MSITTMREAAYAPDTKDATWIPEVAARGWVILTKDKTIRRDSLELGAVLAARAFYFTLGGQNYLADEIGGDHPASPHDDGAIGDAPRSTGRRPAQPP